MLSSTEHAHYTQSSETGAGAVCADTPCGSRTPAGSSAVQRCPRGPERTSEWPRWRRLAAVPRIAGCGTSPLESGRLGTLLPPDALRVRQDRPRLFSPPAKMLRLLWCPVLLGWVTAGPDTAPQASDGPQLWARAGQDITLVCRARAPPKADLRHLRVHWHLLREPAGGSVVHSYHTGADQLGDQAEEFRGRTRLLLQGILQGVVALSLTGVRPSDSGTYRCFIMDSQADSIMDIVLHVAAPYEPPQLAVLSRAGGRLALQCRSAGGYPQPEITWHDRNGTRLSQDEPVELQRSRQGGFEVRSSLSLTPRPGGSICCTLSHRPLQQNMSVCETLPAGLQALEQRFPGWAMAVVTLALVTLMCVVLIHWGLPLIPAEGLHLGWRRAPSSQHWHRVRTDPPPKWTWLSARSAWPPPRPPLSRRGVTGSDCSGEERRFLRGEM